MSKYSTINAVKFFKMREEILHLLDENLPDSLTYHKSDHTRKVEKSALLIGKNERISDEDLLIIRSAVLYHDAGFIFRYHDNEVFAIEMVENKFPKYGYSTTQIERVIAIIHSTKKGVKASSHLDEIMSDADHDYFGREDYYTIAQELRDELKTEGIVFKELDWLDFQLNYLEGRHRYFTKSSIELRKNEKKKRIEELKQKRLILLSTI